VSTSKDLLQVYQGRLAEQFVGQQLLSETSEACENKKLYCWIRPEKSSSAEVDFVLVREGKIFPVEVKSGKSGRLKSLHLFLEKYGGEGICLQDTDQISREGKICFAPLYTIL